MITALILFYLGIYLLVPFLLFALVFPFSDYDLVSILLHTHKKVTFPSTHTFRIEHLWQLLLKLCSAFSRGGGLWLLMPPTPHFSRQLHDVQAVAGQGHGKGAYASKLSGCWLDIQKRIKIW